MLCTALVHAQSTLYNEGAAIYILPGTSLNIQGDYQNEPRSLNANFDPQVTNVGEVRITGDILNNSGFELFLDNNGMVIMNGSMDQAISGNSQLTFYDLNLNKSAGTVNLQRNISVENNLSLSNGSLNLNNSFIDLGFSGVLELETDNNRIYSTGSGYLNYVVNSNPSFSESLGGLGLYLEGDISGGTIIQRLHTSTASVSDGSIARMYKVQLIGGDFIQSLKFSYLTPELNGIAESDLAIYSSSDNGTTWEKLGGIINTASNIIEVTGQNLTNAVWLTLADANCSSAPTVDLGEPVVNFCAGDNIVLDAGNPGNTYLWSTGETTQIISVSSSGTYSVVVSNQSGCENSDTIQLIERQIPSSSFTSAIVCIGETTSFTNTSSGEGNLTHSWNFGDPMTDTDISAQMNPQYEYPSPGKYTVELTTESEYGCSDIELMDVYVAPYPIAAFSVNNACMGENVVFQNLSDVDSTILSTNGLSFSWDFGDGKTSSLQNPSHSYLLEGVYTVSLEVVSNAGCSDVIQEQIQIYEAPVVDFDYTAACADEPVFFANNTTISSGGLNFTWDFGDGTSSSDIHPEKVYTNSGTYQVTLDASTNFGCTKSATHTVIIQSCEFGDCLNAENQPMVDLGADKGICNGESISLDAGNLGSTYLWSDGSTNRILNAVNSGTYWVEVTNALGCLARDEVEIVDLTFDLPDTVKICVNSNLLLEVPFFEKALYEWSSLSGVISSQNVLEVSSIGQYFVTVEGSSGCIMKDTINVINDPKPITARFLASSIVDVGDTLQFIDLSYPSPASYEWSFGDGVSSFESDPYHVYLTEGSYDASLIVSDGQCNSTRIKTITVRLLRQQVEDEVLLFTEILKTGLYPNPTHGELNLDITLNKQSKVQIGIYDSWGRALEIRDTSLEEATISFDVSTFSPGVYYLKVLFSGKSKVFRFVNL
ncbi:PKD domain-containing protein [Fulvivirga sp. 29W222]|uniref:PKD domain-containing protein n=1 Tax=Fulvivirga marina TaxID=2494733 RepID=A0A937FV14_9BACT|nr:PKD domain-containing protein [Fulvivirga marina]MBL6446564.1 PKD domain-containing protein [Fulvivirga marina]